MHSNMYLDPRFFIEFNHPCAIRKKAIYLRIASYPGRHLGGGEKEKNAGYMLLAHALN